MGMFSYSVIDMLVKLTWQEKLKILSSNTIRIKAEADDCSGKITIVFDAKPYGPHDLPKKLSKDCRI